jgi:FecR protein
MNTHYRWPFLGSAALVLILMFAGPSAAVADEGDPPSRVARLAYVEGSVSLQPGGTDEWVDAPLNRPLTTGDAVWSDVNSRVELQLDGSLVRLSSRTSIAFLNVADHVTQIQLSAGTMMVRVRRLDDDETYEIDTPNLALSLVQPGLYRVSVDDSGAVTTVAVRRGQAQVTGGGADFSVSEGQQVAFSGTDTLNADAQPAGAGASPFDVWSANRDARWDHSVSANYVSPDVVGYTDLDDQGDWSSTPEYGDVWFPSRVPPGWAPYHFGHWVYIAPWGYTWVDDQPWGFAPFHYGRWISAHGAWGWVPCPPRPRGGAGYVRPVYAPALVAWVGGGAGVAWFALGPREVYVPSYPVSRGYVHNINISNTVVNRTVINNFYNTANNRNDRGTHFSYMNRGVPGAIAATTTQAFSSAQPVGAHRVQFDPRAGRVQAFAPAAVPTRQAVLGLGRQGAHRPPSALETRPVVARTAPPPPPPTFERRQQAIQQNGGRPLSLAAVRQIQPQATQRPAPIRIAPQVTQGSNRPGNDFNSRRNGAPQVQQPIIRTAPGVQPPRPPDAGNTALQPQHLQDQRQQQLQQLQQRQQQEQDARRQQQPDQQRQQQMEQQQGQQRQQQLQQAPPQQRAQQQQQQLEQQHQQQLQQAQQQQRAQQQQQQLDQQHQQQLQQAQQQQHAQQQQQQLDQQRQQQLEAQQQQRAQQQQQQLEQQHQQQLQQAQQQQRQQQLEAQQQQRAQQQLQQQQQQQRQQPQPQPQPKPQQDVKPPVRHDDKPRSQRPNDVDH